MSDRVCRTKIDWFVDNVLKQTFNSYNHAVEVLQKENESITYTSIKAILNKKPCNHFRKIHILKDSKIIHVFNSNVEFMEYYKLDNTQRACNVINKKVKFKPLDDCEIKIVYCVPDLRFHVEEESKFKICSYCQKNMPYTAQYFYLTKPSCSKCKKCYNNSIASKDFEEFQSRNVDLWKNHEKYTHLYFERDTTRIFNINTKKYIYANPVVNGHELVSRILKWEAFYGEVPENKLVKYINSKNIVKDTDGIELDNLCCEYLYCSNCNTLIVNPTINNNFCSTLCSGKFYKNREKENMKKDIIKCLNHKCSIQRHKNKTKYNIELDYKPEYLLSLGNKCTYCGIECKFGHEKDLNHPDTLTFDKKYFNIGYCKENIVVSCWFCNRMKNKCDYGEWNIFLDFIKNKENTILDLTNYTYVYTSFDTKLSNIYYHLYQKSPSYYTTTKDSKNVFKKICQKQSFVDPYFNFFPIVLFNKSLFNVSIDAIDTTLPEKEKHKPDNIQVVPCFFNYGKNILTNDAFIEQWKRRHFKTDFSNCSILFPNGYHEKSYFYNFIIS